MTAPVQIDRASYEAAVAQLRAQIVAYSRAVWATATLTDETVGRLVGVFAPAVRAAQLQVANLTSVYLAAVTNTEPVPVFDAVLEGRGTPPDVVYSRPVIQARTLVSKGKTVDEAFAAGGRRLESLATTDLQMAKIRQADESLKAAGVTKYRRVTKGPGSCALCIIASTQEYRTGKLAPIHPGCSCSVEPLIGGFTVEQEIEALDLLEATHAKVEEFTGISDRGGRAVDYRKLIITREHGEIGPLLAWKGDHFTSEADLNLSPVDLDV